MSEFYWPLMMIAIALQRVVSCDYLSITLFIPISLKWIRLIKKIVKGDSRKWEICLVNIRNQLLKSVTN